MFHLFFEMLFRLLSVSDSFCSSFFWAITCLFLNFFFILLSCRFEGFRSEALLEGFGVLCVSC